MAYCSKCGAQVGDQIAFCPRCGAAQSPPNSPALSPRPGATSGMAENTAGALCYLLGWITGIVFLLIDKRPLVRFHAAQSIVVFGGLHILHQVLALIVGVSFLRGPWDGVMHFAPGIFILHLLNVVTFILWILLMVKAYQGERFKIPVAWEIAEGLMGK